MIKSASLLRLACAGAFALGAWGCGSTPVMKTPMQMEGVAELPPSKSQQVATYRCTIDLQSGLTDVQPGKRAGKEEEAAWKNLAPTLQKGKLSYEVLIEHAEKNGKGITDWALVTVLEKDSESGRLIRKFTVYEFWGAHDRGGPRAMMMKDGHLQFFVQFWTAQ
jgi:hypothetical protein